MRSSIGTARTSAARLGHPGQPSAFLSHRPQRPAVRTDTGTNWSGEYVLDMVGTTRESATPLLVSVPLACGILEILAGRVLPGLHQATDDPESVERWLAYLAGQGITAEYHGD